MSDRQNARRGHSRISGALNRAGIGMPEGRRPGRISPKGRAPAEPLAVFRILKAALPLILLVSACLVFCSCRSLPFLPGRIETLNGIPDWEAIRDRAVLGCGDLRVIADFPTQEIRRQGLLNMAQLCALQNKERGTPGKAGSPGAEGAEAVLIHGEIRERGFMKDLKMRRSVSLVLRVTDGGGDCLARYICCLEGSRTIESDPWLYRLLDRGFGKLFP